MTAATAKAAAHPDALLLRILAMDCPTEEGQIRRALEPLMADGRVRHLRFDLPARTLAAEADVDAWPAVEAGVRGLGFEVQRLSDARQAAPDPAEGRRQRWRLVGALALAVGAELTDALGPDGTGGLSALGGWSLLGMACALGAIGLVGTGLLKKGWASLRRARLDINALMSVAVVGAFALGEWPEAAMVMALYQIAEWIEARAVVRARDAIQGLLALAPAQAEQRQPDGRWQRVAVDAVPVGARVRVRPGERLPLDGQVRDGRGSVDESAVTGESVPVDKAAGDPVFAGTLNLDGLLELDVTAAARDTVLARIIHAVELAQASRAPTQRFVDRFAAVYTPAVFAIALAVAFVGPWAAGWTWTEAVYRALVLLVIACPCALVIATPVTIASALAAGARRGILLKGGAFLEQAHRLQRMALDKTGTLTQGRPVLVTVDVVAAASAHADADANTRATVNAGQALDARPNLDDERSAFAFTPVHAVALAITALSDHPVAAAVARGLAGRGAGEPDEPGRAGQCDQGGHGGHGGQPARRAAPTVEHFTALAGRGLLAQVDGREWALGSRRWMAERGVSLAGVEDRLRAHERAGRTATLMADADGVQALLVVADAIKPGAADAVAALRAEGVLPVMLTGDNAATAEAVAAAVGISDVRAGLLPDDKLQAVADLAALGPVGMVGDGINDAPALARADIGFAMGDAGTHVAVDAADVVIMNDDLHRLAETIRLSRRTHRVLWQNIVLALGIKAGFVLMAVFDSATMWMAVFADMGASLLVVFNGLRLLRHRLR